MKAILVSAALGLLFVSGCGGGQEEEPVRTEAETKQIQTIVSKTDMRSIVSARMDILMVEGKPPKLEAIGEKLGIDVSPYETTDAWRNAIAQPKDAVLLLKDTHKTEQLYGLANGQVVEAE